MITARVNRRFGEAPFFYGFYLALIVLGAGCVLIPGMPLLSIIFYSQVLYGALLPVVLIFMVLPINHRKHMGTYVNGPIVNAIAWTTFVLVDLLTVISTVQSLMPQSS